MQIRVLSLLMLFILFISIQSFSQVSTLEAIIVTQAGAAAGLMRLVLPFLGCMGSAYLASEFTFEELSYEERQKRSRHWQNVAVSSKIVICVILSSLMSYMCRSEYNRVPLGIVPIIGGIIGYRVDDCPKGTVKGVVVGIAGFLGYCAGTWATIKLVES